MSARVLVVDDLLANRRLMQAKLEANYYTVVLADSGPAALKAAVELALHIILLDVMMPGMDGYEVCRRLKNDDRTRHIPIVMLTALSDIEDRIRGLEAGADDFLSKPVKDFDLLARLSALNRYNAVALELRRREATSHQSSVLSPEEMAELNRKASILVIDSDRASSERTAQPLRDDGHCVVTWHDSQSRSAAMSGTVDLILLGLSEQGHDPLRLCAQLNTLGSTKVVSIVVTFDPSEKALATRALSLGASDLVAKPINPQELLARINTQLKRARYTEILRRRVDRGLELSVIDQLTGLYNRRYMLAQLQQWSQRSTGGGAPVSVVAIDIDHFKIVNDRHGHEAGDEVLREFAERLRLNVRPKDIICRPGGEEFLVIMPETSGDLACVGAERIRQAMCADPFGLERSNVSLDLTVSAGVATWLGGEDTVAELLHRADEALYRAKRLGRNRTESLAA